MSKNDAAKKNLKKPKALAKDALRRIIGGNSAASSQSSSLSTASARALKHDEGGVVHPSN